MEQAAEGTLNSSRRQVWKTNDDKANKAGPHRTVFWVKPLPQPSRYAVKGAMREVAPRRNYYTSATYQGSWLNNKKEGFGTQTYSNGNVYEGDWVAGRREGHGTLFVRRGGGELVKVYSGGWKSDKRHGLGAQFFASGDRYEGEWEGGMRSGTGSHWYTNGDVYAGSWKEDQRSGQGTMTYANGNVYEGGWLSDRREGPGILVYAKQGKVLDAEWAADIARCSVLMEAAAFFAGSSSSSRLPQPTAARHPMPVLELENVEKILAQRVRDVQNERRGVRDLGELPVSQLFTEEELDGLRRTFSSACSDETETLDAAELGDLLVDVGLDLSDAEVAGVLVDLDLVPIGKQVAGIKLSFADFTRAAHVARSLREAALDDGEAEESAA